MEISLGRWNTKLFLGRRSYLLSQKKGHTKGSKTIRKKILPQTHAAQTRRESSLRFFSQDVQFDSFGFKKTWENLKPHPLNQKARKRSERSRLFRQMKAIIQCFNQTYAVQTRRESSLRFFFSRRPIWALWRPKSPKRASWEKVWWLDFLKTLTQSNLSFFFQVQKEPPKSHQQELFLDFLAAKKLKLDVLRKSSHQTFSQDALFGLFGRQKTQIGRLEKIKEQNCGSFAVGDWNRVRAIPGLTVHFLVSFAFNGFYCRKLVSNSLLAQKDFSMAGFDIKKTN